MYLIYCTFHDCSCPIRILRALYRRHFKKILLMLVKFGISYCEKNVIIYQSNITRISSNTPLIMSIYLHILFNQFFYGSTLWDLKFSNRLLVLDFLFSFFCVAKVSDVVCCKGIVLSLLIHTDFLRNSLCSRRLLNNY